MTSADYWIHHLSLLPHPEGGFYKETYRASETIPEEALPERFTASRNFSTAIYFLLRSDDRSLFHKIKSDELWHFHKGDTLSIYALSDNGLTTYLLGDNPEKGESLQVAIPANAWFGARITGNGNGYVLTSCTVSPGFDFRDFELANQRCLLSEFPMHHRIIHELTK